MMPGLILLSNAIVLRNLKYYNLLCRLLFIVGIVYAVAVVVVVIHYSKHTLPFHGKQLENRF